jgi:hypothetical protein
MPGTSRVTRAHQMTTSHLGFGFFLFFAPKGPKREQYK